MASSFSMVVVMLCFLSSSNFSKGTSAAAAVNCGPPPSITNGSPGTPTRTTFGGMVTYTCNSGYTLSGPAMITCLVTGWSSLPSCTVVDCGQPSNIANGSPGIPTRTTFGGMVTYTCDMGYQISPQVNTITSSCQANGMWATVTCTAVDCGPPPSISNGSPRTPTRTTFGESVTYTCVSGYTLSGPAMITCLATGSWSSPPSCTALPPTKLLIGSTDYPHYSEISITAVGGGGGGSPALACFTPVPSTAEWYFPDGTMVPLESSPAPDNTIISIRQSIAITLNRGNAATTPTGLYCCGSPTLPVDQRLCVTLLPPCPSLTEPMNGAAITYNPPGEPFGLNTVAMYSCNYGYILIGSDTRTCQSDGSWTGKKPTCQLLVPQPPSMLRVISQTSTTILLSWTRSSQSVVDRYEIGYSYAGTCPSESRNVQTMSTTRPHHTVEGLEENSDYIFTITAINQASRSQPSVRLTSSTQPAAPNGEVQGLTGNPVSSTSISINWGPVNCTQRNSRIVGYSVSYTFELNDLITSRREMSMLNEETSFTATGLVPRSNYMFAVSAVGVLENNINVAGPIASIIEQTHLSNDPLLMLNGRLLPNNSVISFSDIQDALSDGLFCITNIVSCCEMEDGSPDGQWQLPDGSGVTQGRESELTYMIRGPSKIVLFKFSGQPRPPTGIYHCEVPTNNNLRANFYVGIYATDTEGIPVVNEELVFNGEFLTLTCTSSGGPATNVVWTRGSDILQFDGLPFSHSQIVNNTETSTYLNILKASDTSHFVGSFSCRVTNTRGSSNTASKLLGGLQIVGNMPLTIGESVSITCVSDIPTNQITWEQNDTTLVQGQSASQLVLTFNPVSDSIHGNIYTCRVRRQDSPSSVPSTTSTTITVHVPPNAISVTISSTEGEPVVGVSYTISCTVAKRVMGLSQEPYVQWLHDDDESTVQTSSPVTTRYRTFSPLKTSNAGLYTCIGSISSPALLKILTVNESTNLILKIPPPAVSLTTKSRGTLYAKISTQAFTCEVTLNDNVDTAVYVNFSWVHTLFDGVRNEIRDSIILDGLSNRTGRSTLRLPNLSSRDDNVSCLVTLTPFDDSYLVVSDTINNTSTVTVKGVYLMFNNIILNEKSEVHISNLGDEETNTITCHSDHEDCCGDSFGQWRFPNNTVIYKDKTSISVTREDGLLRLARTDNITVGSGNYCCMAQDGRREIQTVCVMITQDTLGVSNIIQAVIGGAIAGVLFVILLATAVVVLVIVVMRRKVQSLNIQMSGTKVETQSVPLSEVNQSTQAQPYETVTKETTEPHVYETIATDHEYEVVSPRERDQAEQTKQEEIDYNLTDCPAYLSPRIP